MRLSDTDVLIDEAIERYCENCDKRKGIKNGKWKIVYQIGDAPCRACAVDDMKCDIEDAPTIEPEQRWVPCDERLPEPNTNVLVTLIDRRRRKADVNWSGEKRYSIRIDKIIDYEGDMSHPFWAKGNTPSVIAWMPLPEPYKGDDE